jgi:hypothetical protein
MKKDLSSSNSVAVLIVSASLAFGLFFAIFVFAFVGCSETTVAVDPAAAIAAEMPVIPDMPADPVTVAASQQEEGAKKEEAGMLEKASDLFGKATASGGDSAKKASDWVLDRLGDAQDAGSSTAEDTMKWATDTYQSLRDNGMTTAGSATEWVTEDWNKMGSWEYKVVDVGLMKSADIEKRLNELGAQRWECYHVSVGPSGQTMYFKKPAKSYLKHIPLRDVMKLIPMLDNEGN